MNRGYYYAANGMFLNQRKMDCIGNNLTNVSTSGYKRDTLLTNTFDEQMILPTPISGRRRLSLRTARLMWESTVTCIST